MDISKIIDRYKICKENGMELLEQDTKNAFIVPVLRLLGYDIEDIFKIKSEYKTHGADAVDYAILKEFNPYIFIEAKKIEEPLEKHISQLKKYYNMTLSVKYGILTNGIDYWCFTDSQNINVMDDKPFLKINLLSSDTEELNTFFDLFKECNINNIENNISNHLDKLALDNIFNKHINNISDEFIDFIELITGRRVDKNYVNKYIKENLSSTANIIHRVEIVTFKGKIQLIDINNKKINCNTWKACYVEFFKWIIKEFNPTLTDFLSKSYYFESISDMPDYLQESKGYYKLDDGTYISSHMSSSYMQSIIEKVCDYYNINYKLSNIETNIKDCD